MTIDITPEAVEHLCAIHEGYEQHGTVATLRALTAALTASQAETAAAYGAVKVKPLVWSPGYSTSVQSLKKLDKGCVVYFGTHKSDKYTINTIKKLDQTTIRFLGQWWPNLDAAKAAAQADYDSRILTAIEKGKDHE